MAVDRYLEPHQARQRPATLFEDLLGDAIERAFGEGVQTLPELVAKAKAGKPVSYATPGAGSPMHIAGEWLNKAAGVKFSHVPYRGVGPSVTDVVAGHVDIAWVTFGPVFQYSHFRPGVSVHRAGQADPAGDRGRQTLAVGA